MSIKHNRKVSQKGNSPQKRRLIIAAAGVLLIVVVAVIAIVLFSGNKQIMKINNVSVEEDEMRLFLQQYRADVISRYTAGKGLEYNEEFWDTEVDGTTPMEEWLQLSTEKCIYESMVRQLAKEEGLTSSVTYDSCVSDMKKENRRRAQAIANGEVIYGPEKYEIETYLQITLSNLYEGLQKNFIADYEPDEAALEAYYEENIESFVVFDIREIQQIAISYGREGDPDQAEAERIADEIHAALIGGEAIRDVIVRYAEYAELTDKEYDRGRNDRTDAMTIPQTYANAVELQVGECSAVTNENNAFYISRCIALFPGGYEDFDNVKESIAQKVSEQAFEQYLDEQIAEAEVTVDEEELLELAQEMNQ